VDPPLLPLLGHQSTIVIGPQPTIVTTWANARLPDLSGRCTPINDHTSDMSSSIRVPLADNNWQALFQLYHMSLFIEIN